MLRKRKVDAYVEQAHALLNQKCDTQLALCDSAQARSVAMQLTLAQSNTTSSNVTQAVATSSDFRRAVRIAMKQNDAADDALLVDWRNTNGASAVQTRDGMLRCWNERIRRAAQRG